MSEDQKPQMANERLKALLNIETIIRLRLKIIRALKQQTGYDCVPGREDLPLVVFDNYPAYRLEAEITYQLRDIKQMLDELFPAEQLLPKVIWTSLEHSDYAPPRPSTGWQGSSDMIKTDISSTTQTQQD